MSFLLTIESFEFQGAPTSFEDENGDNVKIVHTLRGFTVRTGPHVVPIAIGDRIITLPFFKVVSKAKWKKIIEDFPNASNSLS